MGCADARTHHPHHARDPLLPLCAESHAQRRLAPCPPSWLTPMAAPGRYREAFDEYLSAVIKSHLPNVRLRLFIDWIEHLPFGCENCHAEFTVTADQVNEDDPILCERCRRSGHRSIRR